MEDKMASPTRIANSLKKNLRRRSEQGLPGPTTGPAQLASTEKPKHVKVNDATFVHKLDV